MKTKVITVATNEAEGLERLKNSCAIHDIDLEILGMGNSWMGFGSKIIWTKEYLEILEGYTHFIFIDAYDVLFFEKLEEIEYLYEEFYKDKILFSGEKGCYPDWDLMSVYPEADSEWKYLNSGSYMAPIDSFLKLFEKYPVKFSDDDQRYFTNIFLNDNKIILDTKCIIFQSIAFQANDDFIFSANKVINNKTKSMPSIVHGNGRTDLTKFYSLLQFETLEELIKTWKDEESYHKMIHNTFSEKVNNTYYLKDHRDFVQQNAFGFGERSFHWMWKLIVDKMPREFSFLEIGVFRGQVLSLIKLLSNITNKISHTTGVTPLNGADGHWESDYRKDIETIHDRYSLEKNYEIIHGYSTDQDIIEQASKQQYDIVYIDGGHTSEVVSSDLKFYLPLVKQGGYLVIDDSACKYHMPWGYFQGIAPVCNEVDKVLPNDEFKELFNVVHNRVWQRI